MLRPILDPLTAANGQWPKQAIRVIDPKIRDFGYMPNAERLLPGDVLLVNGNGLVPRLISHVQKQGGFEADHACWTHAALYIGNERLVEATPFGGIRVGHLAEMTFKKKLLVRRLPESVSNEDRYKIAIDALTGLNRGYSFNVVPGLCWHALRHTLWQGELRPNIHSVTICSTVVRNAYTTAVFTDLMPRITAVAWPADLSRTSKLEDTEIGWAQISG